MNSYIGRSIMYSWAIDAMLFIVLLAMPTSVGVIFAIRVLFVHFYVVAFMHVADYFDEHILRARLILGAVIYAIAVVVVLCIWYR